MTRRIQELNGHLGPLRAAAFLFTKLALKMFQPCSWLGWSQFGEDKVIRDILGLAPGYYVDVGCNHPIKWSNTYLLYLHGWKGLLIDANEPLIAECRRRRPLDKAVCCLIGQEEGTGQIAIYAEHALSSAVSEHNKARKEKAQLLEVRTLPKRTLTQLLRECGAPHKFELLSVDVEGMDMQVLRGLDMDTYHPKLIVVEDAEFDPRFPDRSAVAQFLFDKGYRLYSYIYPSIFFLAPGVQSKASLMSENLP